MIGIYKIENKINHKVYIGQSWNIEKRFREHRKNEGNSHLKNSFNKYGLANFSFDVLITFESVSQKGLDVFEHWCMKKFNSLNEEFGYNKREAGSRGIHSEETKKKMSISQKGHFVSYETRKKFSDMRKGEKHCNYGKHLSEETKEKIRNKNSGKENYWFGKHLSEETKKKMSETHKNNRKYNARKVKCIETGESFETITAAANSYGLKIGCIQSVCKGKSKATGGYKWEYID